MSQFTGSFLGTVSRLLDAESRSISPENFSGEPGAAGKATKGTGARSARGLGQGWKVSPSIQVAAGDSFTLADISGSGTIVRIWITTLENVRLRHLILRMYWDGQDAPSVEVPLGDFFCCGWESYSHVASIPVCVNPGRAFNCYWEMPFRKSARITLENRDDDTAVIYYQIDYSLSELPRDRIHFHAQFRRSNPTRYGQPHTLLDGVRGRGQYVGTYMAWGSNNSGWWGEGEVKFYIDNDVDFPSICSTGTEDYFGGSHNFDIGTALSRFPKSYTPYSTAFVGLPEVLLPDGVYRSQQRFGMYRWHIPDPIRFREKISATIQALGWRTDKERRYLPLQDDVASTVFWYQTLPTAPFPPLPNRDCMEVI